MVALETRGRLRGHGFRDGSRKLAGTHGASTTAGSVAWRRRWMRMLVVSCARACASSLASTHPVSPEGQAAAQEVPAAGESDASTYFFAMSGWQWQWPLPSLSTTAHSARRWQGPGWRYELKCTAKSGSTSLPGRFPSTLSG